MDSHHAHKIKKRFNKIEFILLLNSTESNLRNGWLTIPISVIDNNRHILSAGLCYVAFETEEIINFMFSNIFADNINNFVIITDEDQTYKSVIKELAHEPKHILCAFHKFKNFVKHLNKSKLSKDEKIQAKMDFSNICYSKNQITVEKSFSSLLLLKDKELVSYIRDIYAEKNLFSKAFINVCTLGYNTSSVAESMNNMIKIDTKGKKLTLKEFRKSYDEANKRAERNANYNDNKMMYPTDFPFISIKENVSKRCVIEIYKNIKKSISYTSIAIDNGYIVTNNKFTDDQHTITINENEISCTCNQNIVYGYPCVHILNAILNYQFNLDINIINKHWLVTEVQPNIHINEELFGDLCKNISNDCDSDDAFNVNQNQYDININSKKRYCKIMYIGKQLARIGSITTDSRYNEIIKIMSELLSNESRPINEANEPEIAVPRKKGRKRNNNIADDLQKCRICFGNHRTEKCSVYNYYTWRKTNPNGDKRSKLKCTLCCSFGHVIENCDIKIGGINNINDELIFNFYKNLHPKSINELNEMIKIIQQNNN